MRHRLFVSKHFFPTQFLLITSLGVAAVACDDVTTGQDEDPAGNPVLLRIMVQDESRGGGRGLATDLLDQTPPRACDIYNPCAAGWPTCSSTTTAAGVCPDPYKVSETPPAVGTPISYGGNQIRLVFNKLIQPSIDAVLQQEGSTAAMLMDSAGNEVPTKKYWDPAGDPDYTSSVITDPYGPAIVLKNLAPLDAGSTYQIMIDLAQIKDRTGNSPTNDVNGAIKTSYDLVMEGLYALAIAPDFTASEAVEVAPDDFFQIATNANVDPTTSTSSTAVTVDVKNEAGETVRARAFAHCVEGELDYRTLDIVALDAAGAATTWAAGTYTIAGTALLRGANGVTPLKYDVAGTALAGTFVVNASATTTNPIDGIILPEDCKPVD